SSCCKIFHPLSRRSRKFASAGVSVLFVGRSVLLPGRDGKRTSRRRDLLGDPRASLAHVFGPKGQQGKAQGNALGLRGINSIAPKRAKLPELINGRIDVAPIGAWEGFSSVPRAMPWAFSLCPIRGGRSDNHQFRMDGQIVQRVPTAKGRKTRPFA